MAVTESTEQTASRWRSEALYFDNIAKAEEVPISADVIERYRNPPLDTRYPLEYQFALLGDLTGKRVLEIGCGTGGSSIIMALRGATVVGVDISPESMNLARMRASHHKVESRTSFICSPFEKLRTELGPFDIIWIEAFLHHLPGRLDYVFDVLSKLAGQRGRCRVIAKEPVILSQALRIMRGFVPIPRDGTPDERPLDQSDFESFLPFVSDLHMRSFSFLTRLERLFGEGTAIAVRYPGMAARVNFLTYKMDSILPVSLMRRLGGTVVFDCTLR